VSFLEDGMENGSVRESVLIENAFTCPQCFAGFASQAEVGLGFLTEPWLLEDDALREGDSLTRSFSFPLSLSLPRAPARRGSFRSSPQHLVSRQFFSLATTPRIPVARC